MSQKQYSRKAELIENYEEAAFALFADQMMRDSGKADWEENERLKRDPKFVISEGLDKSCLRIIDHSVSSYQRRRISHKAGNR